MVRLSAVLIILAILNTLDWATTIYGVGSGIGYELNPFSRQLLENGTFTPFKIGLTIMLCITSLTTLEIEKRGLFLRYYWSSFIWYVSIIYATAVTVMYIIVVANNFMVLLG